MSERQVGSSILGLMALAIGVYVPAICHSTGKADTRPHLVGHDPFARECFVMDGARVLVAGSVSPALTSGARWADKSTWSSGKSNGPLSYISASAQ